MAIKILTIGGLEDVLQFDDAEFPNAIDTTEPINVGGITTGAMPAITPENADLVVLRDVTNSDELSTCTIAQLSALIKGILDSLFASSVSMNVAQVSTLTTQITMAGNVSAVVTQVSVLTVIP